VAQVRAVGQPDSIMGRVSGEHWAGRLYMRHLSPYLTARLAPTSVSADAVTWWMIVAGWAAAAVLTLPGWWWALAAVLLIQVQLLFDCSDGELARWRGTTGPRGVYLDRVGHWSTEAMLAAAIGVRADGGWSSIGGWTTLGLVVAVLVLWIKGETELVHVARYHAGLPELDDSATSTGQRRQSMPSLLGRIRRLADLVPFHRALLAIEATVLALVAAIVDAATGGLEGTRALVLIMLGVGVIVVVGHLLTIVTSSRLRAESQVRAP
jgi:hypothetical protein